MKLTTAQLIESAAVLMEPIIRHINAMSPSRSPSSRPSRSRGRLRKRSPSLSLSLSQSASPSASPSEPCRPALPFHQDSLTQRELSAFAIGVYVLLETAQAGEEMEEGDE